MHKVSTTSVKSLSIGSKLLHYASSAALASCLVVSMIAPGYGQDRIRWTPDTDRGNVGSTLSGGRRGQETASCNNLNNATQLALMIPGDESKLLTTRATPTLAWHISTTAPTSITFHFADPEIATPIYSKTLSIDHTTTVRATLPEEYHLEPGKQYRWTVFASCPDETDMEISARSFIEYVNRESLDVINLSSLEQASVYADQGIWYDAMAALLAADNQGVGNVELMVQTLLEQGHNTAEVTLSTVVDL